MIPQEMPIHLIRPCVHYFYRPQQSCGKVMFLNMSVILFTWGVYASVHAGIHPPGRHLSPEQTATAADGTHPTGMHSCFLI